ncbi:hypothetical protein [Rhizobium leguminosarum]|uniref:hypothetical protein n=1 Tax=Rhizobium leguminosarum TaxID=384 RepID=UPI001C974230|nr:hypothetical protein [Rhizobium leguminosarum]MBY5371466.1 hypothetical protein [Rhizobium leguminosarum]
MYQAWFYVGISAMAASTLWSVAELLSARRNARILRTVRSLGTMIYLSPAAVLLSGGASAFCYLNIYRDYGAASRADLPRVMKELADAEQARKDAAANAEREAAEKEAAERARLLAEADRQHELRLAEEKRCGLGTVRSAVVLYEVRAEPKEGAERFVNEKASNSRKTHYRSIDSSTMVRIVGCKNEWREVQVTSPPWLTDTMGWVPASIIREIQYTPDGKRVYVEADFSWEWDTLDYKDTLLSAMNKISRETPGCSELDTASLARSPTRGTPADPVFFITCDPNGRAMNVWFKPTDG